MACPQGQQKWRLPGGLKVMMPNGFACGVGISSGGAARPAVRDLEGLGIGPSPPFSTSEKAGL
eukprot:12420767-Alexandrium_andersonii.AAC.1